MKTPERLYESLSRMEYLLARLRTGRRPEGIPLHKTLRIPPEDAGRYGESESKHYINDLILRTAGLPPEPAVLDAGCGFGATVFHWQERIGGRYTGLSTSRFQVRMARRIARHRGLSDRCRFLFRGFDRPLSEKFDVIIAIESLVHSADLTRTVRNLAGMLAPHGRLILVEDVASERSSDSGGWARAALQKMWRLWRVPTEADYREAFAAARLRLIRETDLTPRVVLMDENRSGRLEKYLRVALGVSPVPALNDYLRAHLGGLALQRLYRMGEMRYLYRILQREPVA